MDPASASRVLLAKAYVFCHILKTQRLVCMSCACFLDKSTCRGMYCLVVSGRPWRPTRPATMRGQQQTRVQPGTAVKPIVGLVPDTVLASLMHHAARRALCQSRLGRRQQQPRTMGLGGGVNAWRYGLPDITPQRNAGAAPGAPRRPDINARWRERDERWGTTLLSARTPTSNRQIQPRFFLEPACPHGLGKHSAQPGHTQTTDPSACGREGVANGCAPRRRAHIHMSCSQAKSQTSGRRGFGCWVCRPTVGHTIGGACTHCNWLPKKKVHATVVPQTRP